MNEANIKRIFYILCEKIEQYKNDRYGDFFLKDSDDFFALVALVYMLLVKETIITKDKKNPNIYTRLELNIDSFVLNDLINKNGLKYLCDDKGKDSKWLYDAIRDSILHSPPIINFENKTVHIKNNMKDIECDIPFDFFTDIAGRHFTDGIILKSEEYKTDVFILDYNTYIELYGNDLKDFNNYNEYVEYAKKIKRYNIRFKSKNININNEGPFFNGKVTHQTLNWFTNSINLYVDDCSRYAFKTLESQPKPDNYNEYNELYDKYFCKKMENILSDKYPNINFKVIPSSVDQERLKQTYDTEIYRNPDALKKNNKMKHYLFTRCLIETHKDNERGMLLGAFNDLLVSAKLAKEINNEPDKVARIISKLDLNCEIVDNKVIHTIRKQSGLTNNDTYDTAKLYYGGIQDNKLIYINNDEFNKLKTLLNINLQPSERILLGISMSDIKKVDKEIYTKYTEKLKKDTSYPSDQDINYLIDNYHNKAMTAARQMKSRLYKYYYLMPFLFLYTLGTGIYSINIDSTFRNNEKFIDIVNKSINCYSNSYYNRNKEILPRINEKILEEQNKLIKMQENLKKCNNKIGKKKIEDSIKSIKIRITQYKIKQNAKIIQVNGVNFQETETEEKLSRIRNAFSHLNRIKLLDFNSNEIELIDYNDKNKPVAIIRTSIDKFFKLFKLVYTDDENELEKRKTK